MGDKIELFIRIKNWVRVDSNILIGRMEFPLLRLGGKLMRNEDGSVAVMSDRSFKITIEDSGLESQVRKYIDDCGFDVVGRYPDESL